MPPSSQLTRAVARQYDLFQGSMESLGRGRKYLNYGYATGRGDSYEDRQERLCLEVFAAADLLPQHVVVDVGFGSGEQDFLLLRHYEIARLEGFNVAERQVLHARRRAREEDLETKLRFHHGAAEELPGLAPESVDRMLAIECAFYFDRTRFYRRAAEVLRPGGRLVLADLMFADHLRWLCRRREDFARVGHRSANRAAWERHFATVSVRPIHRHIRPGAQQTVLQILRTLPRSRFTGAETREWLKMAWYTQLVVLGLVSRLLRYDLIVLAKS